ncbi:MAG: hypothetical protein KAZ87_01210 [Spirochaetes bacterium]|nr:hypothetical protein [Spirochaetota bacterium]
MDKDVADKSVKKGQKPSLRKRILRILIIAPFAFTALIFLIMTAAVIFISDKRVESIAEKYYPDYMNGRLELDVRHFNLLSGFDIRDLVIYNPEPFKGEMIRIDKLVLDYSLFQLLTGNIRFNEIGIYSPKINLVQENGVWNFEKLSKPSEKKEEPVEEDSGEPSKEINLPISVEFFLKFILKDLSVNVDADEFKTSLSDFSFSTDVYIPPVKKIPLDISAVKLIETLAVNMNPDEKLNLSFSSKEADVKPPLILSLGLNLVNKDGSKTFESHFKAGTYNSPVRFQQSHLGPLNFQISYDVFLDPLNDFLRLNSLDVKFKDDKWISLAGTVSNMSKNQNIDIRMKESRIDLSKLYSYYVALTKDRSMIFGGNLSLYPLSVAGNASNVRLNGNIKIKNLLFRQTALELKADSLDLSYDIRKKGSEADISLGINIFPFFFRLDKSWSSRNSLSLAADISTYSDFSRFIINAFSVKYSSSPKSENALYLSAKGKASLASGTEAEIDILPLEVNVRELEALLPISVSESLRSVPLKKSVKADLNISFSQKEKMSAAVKALFRIPDYDVKDLALDVSLTQDAKKSRIDLHKLSLGSREFGVLVKADGMIEQKNSPLSDSDIRISLSAESGRKKIKKDNMSFWGSLFLNARMKGSLENGNASGEINIKNFNFEDSLSMLAVNSLNLDFPFEYNLKTVYDGSSRIAVDKSRLLDNTGFKEKNNFKIGSLKIKHPSRPEQFELIRDLSASMRFKGNVFSITSLKAFLMNGVISSDEIMFYLADMQTKNMEYRVSLNANNIDVSQLDRITSSRNTKAEVSLNADISGRGVDFSGDFPEINGFMNIYKIQDKFANRLMKGLSEEKGESKLGVTQKVVDHLNLPSGFYFNIDSGNVYATVTLKRKALGYFTFHIEDDKIQYDRIPIKEYLGKIRKGEVN